MMVPRGMIYGPRPPSPLHDLDEKEGLHMRTRPRNRASQAAGPQTPRSPPRTVSEPESSPSSRAEPVDIPSQRKQRPASSSILSERSITPRPGPSPIEIANRRGSAQDLLKATVIPQRRRPRIRSTQQLPGGNHVADFSKLLLDDVAVESERTLSRCASHPQFDSLFGNIDELLEGQMIVGSEGVDASILSARSVSSDSMPSLDSRDELSATTVDLPSLSMSGRRATPDRRMPLMATSQDCNEDHPLIPRDEPEPEAAIKPLISHSPPEGSTPLRPSRRPVPPQRATTSFKSTLSASLRAIKSAAESLSHIATAADTTEANNFFSHGFFDIQPSLTDDRRPPPSQDAPSPELRRYLNPSQFPPDSPMHLHIWHDDRPRTPRTEVTNSKRKSKARPPSPPREYPTSELSSCIPPTVRTAHASSPPIWLNPDGTPSNKATALPLNPTIGPGVARQREPRENPDFLRVFVAEMNMRRAGKLEEGGPRRAKMWVEARQQPAAAATRADERRIDRWEVLGIDEI